MQGDSRCTTPYGDKSQHTAETYYANMKACLNKNDVQNSVAYFSLAGVQTWYDADKNPGKNSIERHKQLLKDTLASVNKEKVERFWTKLNASLKSPAELENICAMVSAHAPYGDEAHRWKRASSGYIHCPERRNVYIDGNNDQT
jgi:hypothetical protein